jgi:hypothetical protein|nr:MAG TPA: hypothetical protein [Caudoviricetes sp.]
MFYLKDLADTLSLAYNLPNFLVNARDDRILMDSDDYRLDLYGWPDNRVVFADKLTGKNVIKRFGPDDTVKCWDFYIECLETLGVDTTALGYTKG